jgi:hypothetical protein
LSERRVPQIGDVFEVPRARSPVLGRVVSTSAVVGPTHGCILVYLYGDATKPARDALLSPPMITTRAPWSRGTFRHLRSEPLLPGQYFEVHCFRDLRGDIYDEEGRPLESAAEPVGEYRLWQPDAIEAVIAKLLTA